MNFLQTGILELLEKSTEFVTKYKQIQALKNAGSESRAIEMVKSV